MNDSPNKRDRLLLRQVWRLALPLFVALGFFSAIGIVDVELAGQLGASAQAALGIGDQVLYLTLAAGTGLSIAASALVSRCFGANDKQNLARSAFASLLVSAIFGGAASLLAWFFAKQLSAAVTTQPDCMQLAEQYIRLCAPGNAPFIIIMVLSAIFRSVERPRSSLLVWLFTSGLTVSLSLALFAVGPLSRSLDALCIAWDVGSISGCMFGFSLLHRLQLNVLGGTEGIVDSLRDIVRIAIPAALSEIVALLAEFAMYRIFGLADDCVSLQAAWTVFLKIEECFVIMPITAICLALAVVVGQSIGRHDEESSRATALSVAWGSSGVALIGGCAIAVAAPGLSALFSIDVTVSSLTTLMLLATPLLFPALSFRLVMFSAMEGAGRTAPCMVLALTGNFVKILLSWFLAAPCGLGLSGVLLTLLLTRIGLAAVALKLFHRGYLALAKLQQLQLRFTADHPN